MDWDQALADRMGPEAASRYRQAFDTEYKQATPLALACLDIQHIDQVVRQGGDAVELWPGLEGHPPCLRFYSTAYRYLDEWMPLLRNLGLRVTDQSYFRATLPEGTVHIRCFRIEMPDSVKELTDVRQEIINVMTALLEGRIEDDALNGLVIKAGLHWRLIDALRGYRNYFLQLSGRIGQEGFHQALLKYPQITALLAKYFHTRFDPDLPFGTIEMREEEGLLPLRMKLQQALGPVSDIHADHLFRTLFNLIDASVRTNFFRPGSKDRFAFKLSSLGIIAMPAPRPLFEIYVHSRYMEAVHLRGGKVSRGGIRWSDRPQDFRTEIWDLMRTQMLKNALIVPQGAKGGFVIKDPDAGQVPDVAYILFMRALLDLTDNLERGEPVHPPHVLCYDGFDPYLVVAADKGTAHLSDTANQIARQYGFWLADAFASGGSRGYDHKKLGITAKGAWECARHHFYELQRDLDKEVVTVIGIGSMNGDVFGNGMLLSKRLKLKAAFSGRFIFLDPDPDPENSFAERQRLFHACADWDQYDRALLSPGGGVWSREDKTIPIASSVQRWLGLRHQHLDGETLIRHILMAEADLFWLGGIGTYVKASDEKHPQVGDPGNDTVRIDASQLRVKVVAEGANLGFTQRGRIEYALNGGRINMDAIDNSGGVDLSDHEVNFKILLRQAETAGTLGGRTADAWLNDLVDETIRRVLDHSRGQSLCLSLERIRCSQDPTAYLTLADKLENTGLLNREAESFPLRDEVLTRPDCALTRPELAVLLSLAKMQFKQALLERPQFLSKSFLRTSLYRYFPPRLIQQYEQEASDHPLAKEITATTLGNYILDRTGSTFLTWMEVLPGPLLEQAIGLYLVFNETLETASIRKTLLHLQPQLPSARFYNLLLRIEGALEACCRWFLARGKRLWPESATLDQCCQFLQLYQRHFATLDDKEIARLQAEGLDEQQARRLALLLKFDEFPVVIQLALESTDHSSTIQTFRTVTDFLDLPEILALLAQVPARSDWESHLKYALSERFRGAAATLTSRLLSGDTKVGLVCTGPSCLQKFSKYQRLRRELERTTTIDLLPFATLACELEGMIEAMGSST